MTRARACGFSKNDTDNMEVEITNMISKTTSGVSGAGSSSADNSDSALQNRMVDVSDVMGAALILRAQDHGDAVPTEMVEAARRVDENCNWD